MPLLLIATTFTLFLSGLISTFQFGPSSNNNNSVRYNLVHRLKPVSKKDTSRFSTPAHLNSSNLNNYSSFSPFLKTSTGSTCFNENPQLVASEYPNELQLEWLKDGLPFNHSGITYNPPQTGTYSVIPYKTSPYEGWNWVSDKQYFHDIQAIQMTSETDIYMADKGGAMKISRDGGASWIVKEFSLSFYDLFFLSDTLGFALAFKDSQNYILRTNDSGENWQEIAVGTVQFSLDRMHFTNESTGFIIGGQETIYKTLDGGFSWILQRHKSHGDYINLNSIHFSDENNGWISGQFGTILKTVDGGENWFTSFQDFHSSINNIFFTSPDTGYILRSNFKAYKSTNGGQTWQEMAGIESDYFAKTIFINSNEGYIAKSGTIYTTLDAGNTWTSTPHKLGLLGMSFFNNSHGILVGVKGRTQITHDAAQSWLHETNFDTPPIINTISFKADTGWAITSNQIGHTLNQGNSFEWTELTEQITSMDVKFSTKWISQNKQLQKSNNGGQSWTIVKNFTLPEKSNIKKIHFLTSNVGFFIGSNGILFKTTNAGFNWDKIKLGDSYTPPSFSDIEFTNPQEGLLTSYNGEVYRTNDAGLHWATLPSLSYGQAIKIHYKDRFKVWIVFENSLIYSNDAGHNWVLRDTYIKISDIEFIDEWNGYAKIYNYLYFTNNGGSSWTRQTLPIPEISTFKLLNNKPLAVYYTNTILKYGPLITKYTESNKVIIQNTPKTSLKSFSTVLCPNESLKLISTGCNGTTKWNTNFEGTELSISQGGTYFSTCTENGCKSPASQSLHIVEKSSCPNITIKEKELNVCPNEDFTINANGCPSGQYLWSNNMNGNPITFNINSPNYELTTYCKDGGSAKININLAPENLSLSQQLENSYLQYKALESIEISSKVILESDNFEVSLKGGKSIIFQPGFESTISKGNLIAEIFYCPN